MPEWTVEGVIDGTWFSQLETYAQEQSALRQVFLRLNTYLDLHILDRVVVNDVVVTDDVLLPYLEYSQADEAKILAGAELEVLTDGEYTLDRVPNDYLGSRERKLFDLWPSEEALYTITPNRSVPFTRYDWSNTTTPSAPSVYQIPDAGTEVLYGMYMGGDISRTVIETDRSGLPDILIYGDSFTNPVECIIWSSFGRMDSLDFRHYDEMTLSQYIDETKPDVVVCIRDYEAMLSTSGNGA